MTSSIERADIEDILEVLDAGCRFSHGGVSLVLRSAHGAEVRMRGGRHYRISIESCEASFPEEDW